jgi:hypothetical protein
MTALNLNRVAAYYGGEVSGNTANIPTPGHSRDDRGTSISLAPSAPDGVLVHCFNGTSADALNVKEMLRRDGFLDVSEYTPPSRFIPDIEQLLANAVHDPEGSGCYVPASAWDYVDANGNIIYRKKRVDQPCGSKTFFYEHVDTDGNWKTGLGQNRHILYRLPDIVNSNGLIFAAEGERCADKLASWGLTSTSTKDMVKADLSSLKGRCVVVLPDNDEAGLKCARSAVQAIQEAGGTAVTVTLPSLCEHGDIVDWQGEVKDLLGLVENELGRQTKHNENWLIPAVDFLSNPSPPKWVIRDLFEQGSFGMIHGQSGSGKSFITIDIAMHLACGRSNWHGSTVQKTGPVIYLAGEGHYGMRRRLAAWIKEYDHDLHATDIHVSKTGCDLDQPEGFELTVRAIEALSVSPVLIVVDTLHRFLSGDENSARDARAMIAACDKLRSKFQCALLLVHHTGVNSETQHRARGSSAWKGAIDFEYSVDSKRDIITFTSRKVKDGPEPKPRHFEFKTVMLDDWNDEDGKPSSSVILVQSEVSGAPRLDNKTSTFIRLITNSWWASGTEVRKDLPYIARLALKEFLINKCAKSDRTAVNELTPSRPDGLVKTLTENAIIEKCDDGWLIVDGPTASIMLMSLRDGKAEPTSG